MAYARPVPPPRGSAKIYPKTNSHATTSAIHARFANLDSSARGAGGGDTAVEEKHLPAHLARRGADQENHAVRHFPGLSEATEGGTVKHGVALRGLTATAVGQSKERDGREGTNGARK